MAPFRRGTGVEHVDPFAGFVGEMWSSIGLPHDGRAAEEPVDCSRTDRGRPCAVGWVAGSPRYEIRG